MSKKVVILFSGGLDSTYLVWKNLSEGNEVYPIYIEIENNRNKSIIEKNRVNLLYEAFDKEFGYKINRIQNVIKINVDAREDSLFFKQVPIWILGILFSQNIGDEIQIGYVSNDDAISYLDDIRKIYNSYSKICEPLKPLVFPLVKKKKQEMAVELPKKYLDLIISCENPIIIGDENDKYINYEPCCDCGACNTVINTGYYRYDLPKIYEKNLVRKYQDILMRKGFRILDKEGNDVYEVKCAPIRLNPIQLKLNLNFNDYDDIGFDD